MVEPQGISPWSFACEANALILSYDPENWWRTQDSNLASPRTGAASKG